MIWSTSPWSCLQWPYIIKIVVPPTPTPTHTRNVLCTACGSSSTVKVSVTLAHVINGQELHLTMMPDSQQRGVGQALAPCLLWCQLPTPLNYLINNEWLWKWQFSSNEQQGRASSKNIVIHWNYTLHYAYRLLYSRQYKSCVSSGVYLSRRWYESCVSPQSANYKVPCHAPNNSLNTIQLDTLFSSFQLEKVLF